VKHLKRVPDSCRVKWKRSILEGERAHIWIRENKRTSFNVIASIPRKCLLRREYEDFLSLRVICSCDPGRVKARAGSAGDMRTN